MVEAVYFGTLIPLLFLVIVIQGEYRKLILFFAWGLTSAIIIYLVNILIDTYFVLDETLLLSQIIPLMEEFLKILPVFFLIRKKGKAYRYNIVRFAMASGIGFSILENYLYLSISASSGLGGSIVFIITRSLTASLLHGSTTALIGYAVQIMHNYNFFSFFLALGMYILAASIHSIYNVLGLIKGLQVIAILIPIFLFMFDFYLFNFFGRKGARQNRVEIPAKPEMKGSTK